MSPKVSVLIPSFNSADFLEDAIQSVLNQSYKNIEVVIVDDGSTDNSLIIAQQFQSDNVIVISQTNGGACKARNVAFNNCTGDLIQYLDADDILSPYKIESQVSRWNGSPNRIISSKWQKFQGSINESVINDLPIYKNYSKPIDLLVEMWTDRMMMQTSVWLIPRELINEAGEWNERLTINQDGEFFCRVLVKAREIVFSDEGTVYYRTGLENSVSRSSGSRSKAESLLASYKLYVDHLDEFISEPKVRIGLAMNLYSFIYIYYHLYPDLVRSAKIIVETLSKRPPYGKVGGAGFESLAPYLGFYNILKLRRLKHRLFHR